MTFTTMISPAKLKPNPRNARTHSKKQVAEIAESIRQFGFTSPILADETGMLIAGHGRLEAALLLKLTEVPVITLSGLSDAKKRALMLADNKIAGNAGWDRERLAIEIPELALHLQIEGVDISVTGFGAPEIDQLIIDFEENAAEPSADHIDPCEGDPVSKPGDLWMLGNHRLLCGNARHPDDVDRLMDSHLADMVFTDPPYNVSVRNIGGRGRTKHREFKEASGEMTDAQFIEFLGATLGNARRVSRDEALHFVCMDWRSVGLLLTASREIYARHLDTCIWNKTNAGQGGLYRSQHEQILVFQAGTGAYINNVELGRHGRSRTNVWTYPGANTFRSGRMEDLKAHPTIKPVKLISDAMRDCTRRGAVVLDIFSGSGTTILAAEEIGRRGFGVEIDPIFVDVAVRRWQALTKKDAIHAQSAMTFDETATKGSQDSGTKAKVAGSS